MIEGLLIGLGAAFSLQNLLMVIAGCVIGNFIGFAADPLGFCKENRELEQRITNGRCRCGTQRERQKGSRLNKFPPFPMTPLAHFL